MSKFNVVFFLLVLAVYAIISSSYSTGITGKSVTGCGGNGCHTMDNGTSILLTGIPAEGYKAGENYTLTLSVINAGKSSAGFNLKCDEGTLMASAGMSLNGNKELYHNAPQAIINAAGIATWTFNWTAPLVATTASFFVAGNSVNTNTASTGDAYNTDAFYFNKDTASPNEVSYIQEKSFNIFPNPTQSLLQIELKNQNSNVELFDFQGRKVACEQRQINNHLVEIQMTHLPKGIYLLSINQEIQKVIKE